MKKVLITGASGYIGQHLAKLLSEDYFVIGMDINPPVDPTVFNKFLYDDIRSTDLDQFMAWEGIFNIDVVVHLAALVQVGESVKKPIDYYTTNCEGTLNLLKHIDCERFIFASTGAAVNPTSPYALSKAMMEPVVEQYCKENNINYTIFRFYNVIGSDGYEPTNPDGLFYNLIKAKETGEFNLYGTDYNTFDGTAVRDYVHVMEICHAIELAVRNGNTDEGVQNLGHGKGYTVMEIINMFKKVNNCDFKVNACQRREGDVESSVLENVSPYMSNIYSLAELLRI